MDVKVWDTSNIEYNESDLIITELPPIPEDFQREIQEAGGYTGKYPNLRVVSGLDPTLTEFVGGRYWLKYAFREHIKTEYAVWHKPNGEKKLLTPKEAQILGNSKKLQGIIIPTVETKILEYGIPRYFLEVYRPAEYYGTPEAWEFIRYDEDIEGKKHDLMGEYPYNGRYETWFCIEEPVLENGIVTGTKFRELDDIVLEFIKFKIEEDKTKTAQQQHQEVRQEIDAEYNEKRKKLKENITDIVEERIDRIIETPKSFVPKNYEHRNKTKNSK